MSRVLHYISGPTSEGPAAYAAPLPRRGVVDEQVWESLCYSTPTGYRPLFLDLHVPCPASGVREEACPLVVWIHGGGWESGSRRRFPVAFEEHWLLERVLLAGFAVARIDYRLSAEADFPAPVDDVRSALAWLAEHADDFGYDVERVVLWGESAGAHLALLGAAAAAGGTPRVAAVVDWYGPTDLPVLLGSRTSVEEEGGEPALSPGTEQVMQAGGWGVDAASPVRVLGADTPPVFIAHGREDATVPIAQSELLRDRLTRLGVPVEYHETDGGHVFEGSDVIPWVISRSLDFLGRTLDLELGPPADSERSVPVDHVRAPAPAVEDTSVPGRDGRTVPVRVQRPVTGSDTVVVYLGGDLQQAARLSAAVPATVVQVGCGVEPDHPPPGAVDECIDAVTWAHRHLEQLGGRLLVLAGEGAAGDAAVATVLHCRDHGIPVAALLASQPAVSLAPADLRGLCPAVVGVGAHSSRFEDTLRFVYRLEQAGVPTRFRIFPTLGDTCPSDLGPLLRDSAG